MRMVFRCKGREAGRQAARLRVPRIVGRRNARLQALAGLARLRQALLHGCDLHEHRLTIERFG